VIDLDSVAKTHTGTGFDKLVALLIGLVALLAAVLAVVQVNASGEQARAQMQASRLIAQIDVRNAGATELGRLQLQAAQRAAQVGNVGGSRGMAGIEAGDEAALAVATAELTAAGRLGEVAMRLGQPPAEDGPVDAYARQVLSSTIEDVATLGAEQIVQADLADAASNRGGMAVLGLSFVALAGVLAGLAGILGDGRGGRLTLLTGYLAWLLALAALLLSLR
jgi:hypothetical protein